MLEHGGKDYQSAGANDGWKRRHAAAMCGWCTAEDDSGLHWGAAGDCWRRGAEVAQMAHTGGGGGGGGCFLMVLQGN